jgi:hypothetical protein
MKPNFTYKIYNYLPFTGFLCFSGNIYSQRFYWYPGLLDACPVVNTDCTTAAVTIGEVYLGDANGTAISSCTSGSPLTNVYLWVNVTSSTKENIYVQFNLF